MVWRRGSFASSAVAGVTAAARSALAAMAPLGALLQHLTAVPEKQPRAFLLLIV